jgi:hypothetical protein
MHALLLKTLVLALLLAMVAAPGSANSGWQAATALAQEDPPAEEAPPAEEPPAEEAPPVVEVPPVEEALPASGPSSDQPWYQWRNQPDAAQQTLGAFLYFEWWGDRIDALAAPDIDSQLNLESFMEGEPLERELAFLKMLDTKKQVQVVIVENRPQVVYADAENYVVVDSYLDRSYLADASTRQPVDGGPPAEPQVVTMAYHLQFRPLQSFPDLRNWKVVNSSAVYFVD